MSEERIKVRPVMIVNLCDKCKDGRIERADNVMLMSDPPKFNYKCTKCGARIISSEEWPRIVYVEEGRDE